MGVRILAGTKDGTQEAACLYDSVTDFVFGPVMDNIEEAVAFLEYLNYPSHNNKDPRMYTDAELENVYIKFRVERRIKNAKSS